jgi:PPM family protein phosphatase
MPAANPQSGSLIVSVGVQCDVGRERTENQDRVTRANTPFGDLFVVADGVGGYQGGAEAAQATVEGFVNFLNSHGNFSLPDALQQAAQSISADLLQRSAANRALHGMGSTVVLCVLHDDKATYAHVGDSRAYLLRDHKLQQLTRDHSVMERLVSQGVLTPAQAREHPDASVLTKALGQSPDVTLDIAEIALQPRDAILLCSDGLWAYAQHSEIEAIAASENLSATAVAEALLNLALKGGGGDNISIQFLRFNPAAESTKAGAASSSGGKILGMPTKLGLPAAALLSVLVICAGYFSWDNLEHRKPAEVAKADSETTNPSPADSEQPESGTRGHSSRPTGASKPPKTTPASTPNSTPASTPGSTTKSDKPAAPPTAPQHTSSPVPANSDSTNAPDQPNPNPNPGAPAATQPAETPSPDAKGKNPVTIVQGPSNSEAEWADKLRGLSSYVTTSDLTGDSGCLALAKSTSALFYTPANLPLAKKIKGDLGLADSALVPLPKDEPSKCGGATIFAMPSKSSYPGQSTVDKLKDKLKKQTDKPNTDSSDQ